ncbi:hypothetical protein GA0061098_104521 [Bradyrhizobium shewense]|uniref:Ubiquitin-like domain-containing protein n=1 Tax=Bradyrhizobium shewense TaxID=1761772 RepID=A0A1C3XTP5_9BRAD|nr:hypothetical protein [Bradyrhizobium shewense]SCB55575.1 hypothetical protein GA0061098_104521 [Bradyrhizobium shewense]
MAKQTLNVTVTYPAAGKPFQDKDAVPTETLASLKARVLTKFGLNEGEESGNLITYVLFKGKERLEDLSVTLQILAGDAGALSLKLSQQIVQGA